MSEKTLTESDYYHAFCQLIGCKSLDQTIRIEALEAIKQQAKACLSSDSNQLPERQQASELLTQDYDPFPNMSRHRVVYLLQQIEAGFQLEIFKGYVRPDGSYFIKTPLALDCLDKKKLPTFLSFADQFILRNLRELCDEFSQNSVTLSSGDIDKLLQCITTRRCFWLNCEHGAITFRLLNNQIKISKSWIRLSTHYYLDTQQHQLVQLVELPSLREEDLQPKVVLDSYQGHWSWYQLSFEFDALRVSFQSKDNEYSLQEAVCLFDSAFVLSKFNELWRFSLIHHCFELPITKDFQRGDRIVKHSGIELFASLHRLHLDGWHIDIAPSFRLQQTNANQWYFAINQNNELSIGVEHRHNKVNLLPQIQQGLQKGQWIQGGSQPDLQLRLNSGEIIAIQADQVRVIVDNLADLFPQKSKQQFTICTNQIYRLKLLESEIAKSSTAQEHMAISWQAEQHLVELAKRLVGDHGLVDVDLPNSLNATLRDYQQQGVNWLQFLAKLNLGGILADDMGLGKTVQIIAHLLIEQQKQSETGVVHPNLVIAPTSLLYNWEHELNQFAPSLKVLVCAAGDRKSLYHQLHKVDVVITSYGVVQRDRQLRQQQYHCVVLDEAQVIKNSQSKVSKQVQQINSQQRFCVTGTPMENHLGELWSLIDFVMPGFLNSKQNFEKSYRIPIEKHGDTGRSKALQKRIAPFVMRRTKQQVDLQLPAKTEMIQLLVMPKQQRKIYQQVQLALVKQIQQAYQQQKGNALQVGNALLKLRQICCDPQIAGFEVEKDFSSAKLAWLADTVPELIEEGRRLLIFSSFTTLLDLVAEQLKINDIDFLQLTGKTKNRQKLVERFQQGKVPVFLISLKAGGAGLNLTAADTVIHLDPWWNPAAEAQASDRSHRIGQDKPVFIYKLICKDSIEQKIQTMQLQKKRLVQEVIQDTDINQLVSKEWLELLQT